MEWYMRHGVTIYVYWIEGSSTAMHLYLYWFNIMHDRARQRGSMHSRSPYVQHSDTSQEAVTLPQSSFAI